MFTKYQFILYHERNNSSLTLENNPLNWDKIEVEYIWNKKYKSLLRSLIGTLEFAAEGAKFIKDIYDVYGIEEQITLTINQLNLISLQYDTSFYTGVINLKDYKLEPFSDNESEQNGLDITEIVSVSVVDSNKLSKLKGREKQEFALDTLISPDGTTITDFVSGEVTSILTPIDLYRRVKFQSFAQITKTINNATDLVYAGITTYYENDSEDNTPTLPVPPDGILFTNNYIESLDLRVYFGWLASGTVINGYDTNNITIDLDVVIYDDSDVEYLRTNLLSISETLTNAQTLTINESNYHDNTYTLPVGYYLKIEITSTTTKSASFAVFFDFNQLSYVVFIEKLGSVPNTYCKGRFIHEALTRLIQLTTSETDTSKLLYAPILGKTDSEFSDYASDGIGSLLYITNGMRIRRRTYNKITCNFEDLWVSVANMLDLSLWYNKTSDIFEIKETKDIRKKTLLLDLGEVRDLKIEIADDYYFNKIHCGQVKTPNYDFLNGVDEINLASEYVNYITLIPNELDLRIPYRLDSVGIEKARRDYSSKDEDGDNDIFIIQMKDVSGDWKPEIGSDVGAESNDILNCENFYNLRYTPKTMLLTNKRHVTTAQYKAQSGKKIYFSKNSKDVNLETDLNRLGEKYPITVSTIYSPIVLPEYYSFKCDNSHSLIANLILGAEGYFKFDFRGKTYYGFVEEISINPYINEAVCKFIKANV
jgi:hypothetical protein